MPGRLSKINPEDDVIRGHVHIAFGEKYTSVFLLDDDREIEDFEIFKAARSRKSSKRAVMSCYEFFHDVYQRLNDKFNPVGQKKGS